MAKKPPTPPKELVLRAPITDHCVEELYLLLARAHTEFSYDAGRLSEPKLKAYIAKTLQEGIVFLAFLDDVLVGSLALIVVSPYWSEDQYITNAWLYLVPEARPSKLGLKLVKMAKISAQSTHLPVNLETNLGVDVESKGRLFELYGFSLIGAAYRHVISERHLRRGSS